MDLINVKIIHRTLGTGTVVAQDGNKITVEFQAKTSKFPYPSAFEKFITPVDPDIRDRIYGEITAAKAEETARKAEEENRWELLRQQEWKKNGKKSGSSKNSYVVKRIPGQSSMYLVFQTDTYEEERKGQFLRTLKCLKADETRRYGLRQTEVCPGDVFFHCSDGYIKALSIIKECCADSTRPEKTADNDIMDDETRWEKLERGIESEDYILDVPVRYDEHKDVIREYDNEKDMPFGEEKNNGCLYALDRKLALYFLKIAADKNEFLYDVPVLSWMLCGVPTITNLGELWDNCEVLESYLNSGKDPEYSFALNLIRRGICFVAIESKGIYRFYPSRFVGYQENSMKKHENNEWKDGKETNPVIGNLLGIGMPVPNASLDLAYRDYCRKLGFEPQDKGAFGVKHKFWELHK